MRIPAREMNRKLTRAIMSRDLDERDARDDPGLEGHVRLPVTRVAGNPSASDIHPRNRTRAGNVSQGTGDAVKGHRTGPGAIPRDKEGKDGC